MQELITFFSFAFVQKALLVGVLLSFVSAVLGVFVLLRRMSFFSDAIAHASLSGIAIGLIFQLDSTVGAILGAIAIGLLIAAITKKRSLSSDTIIGVVFSSSVALAIFIISALDRIRVDLTGLLFGDILGVTNLDIVLTIVLVLATLAFIRLFSKPMLKLVFNRDLAHVENRRLSYMEYFFLGLLAFVIAVSMKIVGAILVSALIIIPAASAQNVSSNLRQMFLIAAILGIVSVVIGLFFSYLFNSPSGSTIVLTNTVFFILSLLLKR